MEILLLQLRLEVLDERNERAAVLDNRQVEEVRRRAGFINGKRGLRSNSRAPQSRNLDGHCEGSLDDVCCGEHDAGK